MHAQQLTENEWLNKMHEMSEYCACIIYTHCTMCDVTRHVTLVVVCVRQCEVEVVHSSACPPSSLFSHQILCFSFPISLIGLVFQDLVSNS